jgi:hypothetical protein
MASRQAAPPRNTQNFGTTCTQPNATMSKAA